jgi:hypothetical protein
VNAGGAMLFKTLISALNLYLNLCEQRREVLARGRFVRNVKWETKVDCSRRFDLQ